MGRNKALWLVLLSAAVVAVLSAGTLAAYNRTIDLSGLITASKMVFQVNGSGEETQSLGVREIEPGGSTTFDIVIDTAGTEVAMDVALSVTAAGTDLPPGLSVRVDGSSLGSSGTGTWSGEYANMMGTSRTVPVVVSWDATADQLKGVYSESRNFTLSLEATVVAAMAG